MLQFPARRRRTPILVLATCVLLAGCSGGDTAARDASATTASVPVPDGVRLSAPGSSLHVGDPATALYQPRGRRPSVVRVRVTAIRRGAPSDFRNYALSARTAGATPWYVRTVMTDVGEAALGQAPVPLFGYDSEHTTFPAAQIPDSFDRCRPVATGGDLGPGDSTRTCLVFFVPSSVRLKAVQLRAAEGVEPISWAIPHQRAHDHP